MISPTFSFKTRAENVHLAERTDWDILIVGGGITGAAVARDAALRGYRCLLLEARDFASGTSSGSSKLIHGGLRYLENFEFKLVRDAIKEREILESLYAPFVRDLSFVFPTYKKTPPPRWKLNFGLFLYDAFSGFRVRHSHLGKQETLDRYPFLRPDSLTGSCSYTDGFAEDYRLVMELIKSAHRHSAVCLSRASVMRIQPEDENVLLEVEDHWNKRKFQVKGRFLFNCAGPLSDSIRKYLNLPPTLELTQGVHFVIPKEKLPIETAFVMSDPRLHRILFAIPWNTVTFLGTTDTPIENPRTARALRSDLDYVLQIANQHFNVHLDAKDVIQSWAAVRPLIRPSDSATPSQISREHHIEENPKNIFHILGGKLTSHRLMAEEALDRIPKSFQKNSSRTLKIPLQDQVWKNSEQDPLSLHYGLFKEDILEIDHARNLHRKTIGSEIPTLEAEVLYAIEYEMALSPLDFMRRRSPLYYQYPTQEVAESVCRIFSREMNLKDLSKETMLQEVLNQYQWDSEGFK